MVQKLQCRIHARRSNRLIAYIIFHERSQKKGVTISYNYCWWENRTLTNVFNNHDPWLSGYYRKARLQFVSEMFHCILKCTLVCVLFALLLRFFRFLKIKLLKGLIHNILSYWLMHAPNSVILYIFPSLIIYFIVVALYSLIVYWMHHLKVGAAVLKAFSK